MAINWTEIESLYVTGQQSYEALAAEQGVSLAAMKEHGTKGGWYRKRMDYRKTCTTKAAEKAAETVADKMAALQSLLLDTALDIATRLNRQLTEAEDIKPSELLQYARTLVALNEFAPEQNQIDEDDSRFGVVILPARTDIDLLPDAQEE